MRQCEAIDPDNTPCTKQATKTIKMTHTKFGEQITYYCQEHFEMGFRILDEHGFPKTFDPSHKKIYTTLVNTHPRFQGVGYHKAITLTQEDITDEMPP